MHPKKSFGSGVLGSATAQRHAACCSDTAAAAALTLSLLLRLDLSLLLLLFCVLPGEVTKINTHVWRYIRRDDDVDVQMNSLLIVPIAFRLPTYTMYVQLYTSLFLPMFLNVSGHFCVFLFLF